MAALGFKKRFVPDIRKGIKNQTIRNFRKVPIVMCEQLYLYTGMRTKFCKKIGEAQCVGTNTITLTQKSYTILDMLTVKVTDLKNLNAFARRDGFSSWKDLVEFWIQEHGQDCFPFTGTIIYFNLLQKKDWVKPGSKKAIRFTGILKRAFDLDDMPYAAPGAHEFNQSLLRK